MKYGVNTFIWGAEFGPADFHLIPRLKEAGACDIIEYPLCIACPLFPARTFTDDVTGPPQ